MIDGIIKFLVLCLGGLLIFLVGHLLVSEWEGQGRPAPASVSQAEPAPGPGKADASADDLVTRRVKTVPVRPEDSAAAQQKP